MDKFTLSFDKPSSCVVFSEEKSNYWPYGPNRLQLKDKIYADPFDIVVDLNSIFKVSYHNKCMHDRLEPSAEWIFPDAQLALYFSDLLEKYLSDHRTKITYKLDDQIFADKIKVHILNTQTNKTYTLEITADSYTNLIKDPLYIEVFDEHDEEIFNKKFSSYPDAWLFQLRIEQAIEEYTKLLNKLQ